MENKNFDKVLIRKADELYRTLSSLSKEDGMTRKGFKKLRDKGNIKIFKTLKYFKNLELDLVIENKKEEINISSSFDKIEQFCDEKIFKKSNKKYFTEDINKKYLEENFTRDELVLISKYGKRIYQKLKNWELISDEIEYNTKFFEGLDDFSGDLRIDDKDNNLKCYLKSDDLRALDKETFKNKTEIKAYFDWIFINKKYCTKSNFFKKMKDKYNLSNRKLNEFLDLDMDQKFKDFYDILSTHLVDFKISEEDLNEYLENDYSLSDIIVNRKMNDEDFKFEFSGLEIDFMNGFLEDKTELRKIGKKEEETYGIGNEILEDVEMFIEYKKEDKCDIVKKIHISNQKIYNFKKSKYSFDSLNKILKYLNMDYTFISNSKKYSLVKTIDNVNSIKDDRNELEIEKLIDKIDGDNALEYSLVTSMIDEIYDPEKSLNYYNVVETLNKLEEDIENVELSELEKEDQNKNKDKDIGMAI